MHGLAREGMDLADPAIQSLFGAHARQGGKQYRTIMMSCCNLVGIFRRGVVGIVRIMIKFVINNFELTVSEKWFVVQLTIHDIDVISQQATKTNKKREPLNRSRWMCKVYLKCLWV